MTNLGCFSLLANGGTSPPLLIVVLLLKRIFSLSKNHVFFSLYLKVSDSLYLLPDCSSLPLCYLQDVFPSLRKLYDPLFLSKMSPFRFQYPFSLITEKLSNFLFEKPYDPLSQKNAVDLSPYNLSSSFFLLLKKSNLLF